MTNNEDNDPIRDAIEAALEKRGIIPPKDERRKHEERQALLKDLNSKMLKRDEHLTFRTQQAVRADTRLTALEGRLIEHTAWETRQSLNQKLDGLSVRLELQVLNYLADLLISRRDLMRYTLDQIDARDLGGEDLTESVV